LKSEATVFLETNIHPSNAVQVRAQAAIGLDIGGTRVKALVVEHDGTVLDQIVRPSLTDEVETWSEVAAELVTELVQHYGSELALGVAAPGLASQDETCIWCLPKKMPGLEGLHWQHRFSWPTPVPVLNDGHAALLGEAWLGAAKDKTNVVMLTLGTGVGGAAMVDGRLLRGRLGRAGHFGHMSIRESKLLSIVNTPGSLEDAVGNLTIGQRSAGAFNDTHALVKAFAAKQEHAERIWNRMVSDLARGIVTLTNLFDPELILLGGGISRADGLIIRELAPRLEDWEWRPGGAQVEIRCAELGDWAGAYGAAAKAMRLGDGRCGR
jgi:glucokinase